MSQYAITGSNGGILLSLDNNYLVYPYYFSAHTHHLLELSIIKSGHGLYEVGKKRYDIEVNDVFIIGNSEYHRIVLRNNEKIHNMVIHFEPEYLANFFTQDNDCSLLSMFFNQSSEFSNRLDRTNPATNRISQMMLDIEKDLSGMEPGFDLAVKITVERILYEIVRNYDCFIQNKGHISQVHQKDLYKIQDIQTYINYNIEKELSLKMIAKIANISPSYFSSVFKRYNGISLSEYISKKRVEYAIGLIRTTKKNLTEIATLCGFNNSTNFNKTFRRITGCTPSSFRNQQSTG